VAVTTRQRERPQPTGRGGFELWTWLFMRISGLILVFLVLGHFTIVHLLGEGVDRVDFAFVSGRWASPFWQTWDWLMLTLGLLHGANGMRVIIDDYVRADGKRLALKSTLFTVTLAMLLLGTLIIFTFDPSRGRSGIVNAIGL
jgi:succinate dehydrogenase membrane anchor subunit